jgi:hypothetical protein
MMKFIHLLLPVFCLMQHGLFAQNAPVSTTGVFVSYGASVTIPITAAGFNNIGSCNLKIVYNPAIVTCTSVAKGTLLVGSLASNLTVPGVITLGWYTYPGVTLPDNTVIFNISFSKTTFGTSAITWIDDGYSCIFYDGNWNPLNDLPASSYYKNGSVTFLSSNAPATIAPDIVTTPGTIISVPVKVTGFNNIGSLKLTMQYDASVLSYQSCNAASGFPGLTVSGKTPGTIIATGLIPSGGTGITLADSTILFTMCFNYMGGSTGLTWFDDGASCQYSGYPDYNPLNDTPTSTYYKNGTVSGGIRLGLKLFIEGAFSNGMMKTSLNDLTLIPLSQPYSGSPWNYGGFESVTTIPGNVVDWVLVELRETTGDASTATSDKSIAKKAAFVMNDGSVKAVDGTNTLNFPVHLTNNLYIVLYHRNHVAVISATSPPVINGAANYDFSSGEFQALGGSAGQKQLAPGIWGMIAGDGNGDGNINDTDRQNYWAANAGTRGYVSSDFSLDSQINNKDKNDFWYPNRGTTTQVP